VECNLDHENCLLCVKFGQKIPFESATEVPAVGNGPNAAVAAARAYGKEGGETRAGLEFNPVKAAAGARQILRAINYNLVTKTDDISNLIKQSTSGIAQNLMAQGIGAVTGTATSGREAIGKLQTEASKMTMDLMGGKLGAGISNTDRDFVLQQLGDVGNANIPDNERLAAWQRALGRITSIASGGQPGAQPQPAPQQPLRAFNTQTNQRIESTDGGKTWYPVGGQ